MNEQLKALTDLNQKLDGGDPATVALAFRDYWLKKAEGVLGSGYTRSTVKVTDLLERLHGIQDLSGMVKPFQRTEIFGDLTIQDLEKGKKPSPDHMKRYQALIQRSGNIHADPADTSSAQAATWAQRRQKRGQPCPLAMASACPRPAQSRNRLTMAVRCPVQNGSPWKFCRGTSRPKWLRSKPKWNRAIQTMARPRKASSRSKRCMPGSAIDRAGTAPGRRGWRWTKDPQ